MFSQIVKTIKNYSSHLLYKFGLWSINANLIILGLDNSGKTTFLNLLKYNKILQSSPTNHPNSEEISIGNIKFNVFDLGGHKSARRLWKDYYYNVDCVIYIIDAQDRERLNESSQELNKLLVNEQLMNTPIIVLGNKVDIPSAVSKEELIYKLGIINETCTDKINVVMCSVVKKFGIKDTFNLIETKLLNK